MSIFRWIGAAFTLYSRIPVPGFTWKEEDMACSLAFFPLVGAVTGALILLVNMPSCMLSLPGAARVMLTILAPMLVTGGFHLDGFMDTEDALASWADREKKLEILKDPHVGAFAVIGLARCLLITACAVTVILLHKNSTRPGILLLAWIFPAGRCLSALTSLYFRNARKSGMLYEETRGRKRGVVLAILAQLLALAGAALYVDAGKAGVMFAAMLLTTLYYRYRAYKEFGGVTGDTAGYYLVSCESWAMTALAIAVFLGI